MYPVSNQFLAAIYNDSVETNLTGTIGSATFTKNNIVAGSFHISNQCTDTSDITLGSVFLGQLTCTFVDVEIAYTNWIGKDITPTLSVKVGENAWESVPLGVFRVMEAKHTAEGVMVTAYDNMRKFDRKIKKAHFKNVEANLHTFVTIICSDCHITFGMTQEEFFELPNSSETTFVFGYTNATKKYSNDIETYRDLLFYVAQTLGCFATIDRNGYLVFRKYKSNVAETISDRQRLSGAQFADYITNYTGIYVTNMKDDTEDYYGYDYELINTEINLCNQELESIESDLVELQRQYDEHEITEEEYLAQKKVLETERKQVNKRLNWLYKARDKAQAGEEGTFMDLGANPFLQDDSSTVRERMRRRVLKALDPISYTPFTCDSVMGAHYDLGDVIYFTGGHAGSDGVFCCVMAFDWTYNAEYQAQGFGVDPSILNTKSRTQKQSKSANTNAVSAIDYAQTAQDTADSKAQDFVSTAYPSANQGKDGDIAVVMMPPFPMKHVADYPGWNTDTFTQNSDGTYKIELSGHTITTGSDPNTVCFEIDGFEESGTYHVDCSVKFLGSQGGAWVQGLGPYIGYSKDFNPNGISVIAGQEGTFITDTYGGGLINIESGSEWHDYSFDFYYSKIMSPDGKMWLKITTDRNYIYGPETPASMYIDNFKITGTTTKPYKVKTIQVKKDGRWNNVDYDDEIETAHDETDGELIANIKNSDGSTTPIYQKAVKPNKNSETPSSNLKELQIGDTDYIIRAQNKVFQYQQPAEQIGAIEGDLYAQICDESGIYLNYDGDHASDIWSAQYFKLTEANDAYFYKLIGEAGYDSTGSEPGMRLLAFNCPVGETVTFNLKVCIRRIAQAYMYLSYDDTKPLGVCFYDPSDSLPALPTAKTGAWHSDINYQEFNKDSAVEGGTVYTYTCTFTAMSETICAYIDMAGLVLNDIDVDKEIDFRISTPNMNLVLKHLYVYGLPEGADPTIAKWYEVSGGGGGSSDVELVELTQAQYDVLTPEEKADPNVIYFVTDAGGGGGGGGTTVIANPTGTPTDQLDTVQIGNIIYEIAGGGGSTSEIIPITAGDGTSSRTFTFTKTPKFIQMDWVSEIPWYFTTSFTWGAERAFFIANNSSPVTGSIYTGVSTITYGADGKSFTITGANKNCAANGEDASGQMYVQY